MSKKSINFKKGDVVRIIEGKKTSNQVILKDLVLMRILEVVSNRTWEKRKLLLEIIEGNAKSSWGHNYPQKDRNLILFHDCLELTINPNDDYEIY